MTAAEPLLAEHEGWLRAIARRFAHRLAAAGFELDDLLQVGRLALVQAAERFEPSRGIKLTTYARPRVVGAMRDLLRVRTAKAMPRDRVVPLGEQVAAMDSTAILLRHPRIRDQHGNVRTMRVCPECGRARFMYPRAAWCSRKCAAVALRGHRELRRCSVCGCSFRPRRHRDLRCGGCRFDRSFRHRRGA